MFAFLSTYSLCRKFWLNGLWKRLRANCRFGSIWCQSLYSCGRVCNKAIFQLSFYPTNQQKPYRVARLWPDFGSHSLTGCWLSLLPEAIKDLYGCQSTPLTSAPCPRSMRSSKQRKKSQILTVPSSEQVANFESVGQKLRTDSGKDLLIDWN